MFPEKPLCKQLISCLSHGGLCHRQPLDFPLCACQTQAILPQSLQLSILLQFAYESTLPKGLSLLHIVLHYVTHVVIIFLAILLPQLLEQVEMTDRSRRTHLRLTCLKSGSNFNSVTTLGEVLHREENTPSN